MYAYIPVPLELSSDHHFPDTMMATTLSNMLACMHSYLQFLMSIMKVQVPALSADAFSFFGFFSFFLSPFRLLLSGMSSSFWKWNK